MNKKIIMIGGLLIAVIVVGLGAYFYQNQMRQTDGLRTDARSLKELLALNTSQQCNFSYFDNGAKTSGKMYVANGKISGEFESEYNGQKIKSYMIIRENNLYTWTDQNPMGLSLSLQEADGLDQTDGYRPAVDLNNKIDYDCKNWIMNETVFQLPNNIQFSSLPEMITTGINFPDDADFGNDGDEDPCDICNQAPEGTMREQCKAALGC